MDNHPSPTPRRFRQRLARLVERLCFWGLAASSLASLLRFDTLRIGMLFTYPPRILWMLVAAILLLNCLISKRFYRIALILLFMCILVWDTPLGSMGSAFTNRATGGQTKLTLLSFNVANRANQADDMQLLANLCAERNVDLLSLQEVSPRRRKFVFDALPEYRFFHGDKTVDFEYAEPYVFSSLIGVKKNLLDENQPVDVFTGITGYRTLAIKVTLNNGQALKIVNVHTTKPFTLYHGVKKLLTDVANKAERHRSEWQQLKDWLNADTNSPTIIAGDFNAPANSYNLRFPSTSHAHRTAGSGLHLTFPRSFPFIGIDHIVATEEIAFASYDIVDAGFSDHCAQVATFFFKQPDSK